MNDTQTFAELVSMNHSLGAWERSARDAAAAGWGWWPSWAFRSVHLAGDINHTPGVNDKEAFFAARRVIGDHIESVFRSEVRRLVAARKPAKTREKMRV